MNQKSVVAAMVLCLASGSTGWAGGLLTNSNQSASFLRNPSRDAVIDIDGVYTNPAGVAFLPEGFHLGLTVQNAKQSRDVTTTFAGLATNVDHLGETSRRYHGNATAPVVPSFQAALVRERWSVSASLAIGGGGGKCEFADGIGSFETSYSLIPTLVNQQLAALGVPYQAKGYSMEMYMKGRQYYWGAQLGGSYKANDNLAFAAGLRFVIASCNYNGYVRNIQLYLDPANKVAFPDQLAASMNLSSYDIKLDTDQSGFGLTPYVSVDWRVNEKWNLAAKYELKTRMRLENDTKEASYPANAAAVLAQFDENKVKSVAEDIPGILTLGIQYRPVEALRLNAGFHHYDDTHATRYADKHKTIDKGTMEITAGVEYDICKLLTASVGYQRTMYSLSDAYMNDLSFNNSSNLLGLGVRLNLSERINVDLGYMQNFYEKKEVTTPNFSGSGLSKTDSYNRENRVLAIGLNFCF